MATTNSVPGRGRPQTERVATLARTPDGWRLEPPDGPGLPVWPDERQRARVTLHRSHPFANSAGWQYLSRFLVMEATGSVLAEMEHVHHANGKRVDDDVANYEVLEREYHGALHAAEQCTHRRGPDGRFVALEEADPPRWAPRFMAIIGTEARDLAEPPPGFSP